MAVREDDFLTSISQENCIIPNSSADTIFVLYLPLGMDFFIYIEYYTCIGRCMCKRLENYVCEYVFSQVTAISGEKYLKRI